MFWKWSRPAATDGVIDLIPILLYLPDEEMGFGDVYDYVIVPHGTRREAGRISLRLGESECVYYFGHIGYHVDPPYRGRRYAQRACRLLEAIIRRAGKRSVVITADPDNLPSRRTCEGLGCRLESIVDVPERIQRRWEISAVKCRYIWHLDDPMPPIE
ncbi:MAG: GNAT family N-acetyltransferase [Clostridia bacterium]|nr:GNAT family N-acetyltransferase [Clostridia bacterium]